MTGEDLACGKCGHCVYCCPAIAGANDAKLPEHPIHNLVISSNGARMAADRRGASRTTATLDYHQALGGIEVSYDGRKATSVGDLFEVTQDYPGGLVTVKRCNVIRCCNRRFISRADERSEE